MLDFLIDSKSDFISIDNICNGFMESEEDVRKRNEREKPVSIDLIYAMNQVSKDIDDMDIIPDFSKKYEEKEITDHVYLTHPNDPQKWVEKPIQKPIYYLQYTHENNNNPNTGITCYNPYYSFQQQNAIANTAQYMRSRGPWSMNYVVNKAGPISHPDQQRTRSWINDFSKNMEKDLNDPVKMSMPYCKKKENNVQKIFGDGFVPAREGMIKSDADLEDNNYYRLKNNMEKISESLNTENKKVHALSDNKDTTSHKNKRVKKTPEEIEAMRSIRKSKTTPSINPRFLDYNFVGKSGEGYWSLGKAQEQAKAFNDSNLMSPDERAYAKAASLKGYNRACEIGSDLSTNPLDDSEESEEYENAGYEQYMRMKYGYIPTYSGSYFGGYGYTDSYGLPTRWFDDHGKCYIPTSTDYKKGRVLEFSIVDEKDDSKNICDSDKEPDKFEFQLIFSSTDNEGIMHIKSIYDFTKNRELNKDELIEEIKAQNARKDFEDALYAKRKNILTEKEQYLSDDSYFVAKEISRYNEHLANVLLWYKENAIERDYKLLLSKCRDQLILYRNEDRFALVKAGVIVAGDKLINVNPKPTNEDEIKDLLKKEEIRANKFEKELISSGINERKAYKTAYKQIIAISKCKSLDEIIETLRSIRNLQVIPKEKDLAMKIVDKIYSMISDMRKDQIANYELFKKIRIGKYPKSKLADPHDDFDKQYDEWWNSVTNDYTTDNDYSDKYSERMILLNQQRLDWIANNSVSNEYLFNVGMKKYNDFIASTCRDKDGKELPLFEKMNNVIQKDMEDSVAEYARKGEDIYRLLKPKSVIGNYHNYALSMLNNPYYINQGLPQSMHTPLVPIYNNPGDYENKQQTFIKAMFNKHKMGSVL